MSKRIYGTIKDSLKGGQPVSGLRVQAWDDDFPDADDFMGEVITDTKGKYSIPYYKSHWDLALGGASKAYPDLYITVDIQNRKKQWIRLGQSKVYKDHDLSRSREINLRVKIEQTKKKRISFDPKKYGFHFINQFVLTPDLFDIELARWDMGFCGGMCAYALYRYSKGKPLPKEAPYTKVPEEGTDLFNDLLRRQIRSMPPLILARIYEWQCAPDEDRWGQKPCIGQRTKNEWKNLKTRLDQNMPTILILIRAHGYLADPTQNHQVLAIGYEYNPSTKDLTIYEYDPNRPDTITKLHMCLGLPNNQLDLVDTAKEATRGFFINTAGNAAQDLQIPV